MTRLSELKIKEIARKGRWSDNDPEITGVETHSLRIKKRDISLQRQVTKKIAMEHYLVIKLLKKVQVL